MIIREIEKDPDAVLASFDWFNDYDDTLRWLKCKEADTTLISRLEHGFKNWLATRFRKL